MPSLHVFSRGAVLALASLLFIAPASVFAAVDGSGTMTVSPSSVLPSTSGNLFTFTFNNPSPSADFSASSETVLTIPADWTPPQNTNAANPGYVTVTEGAGTGTNTCNPGTVSIAGAGPWTITIPQTCGTGDHLTIKYGAGSSVAKVTAPAGAGSYVFTTQTKESGAGVLSDIATSPTITVDATPPTVVSVTSTVSNASYRAGRSINVQVVFSEPVVVTGGTPTITLETGITDQVANYSSGSGTANLNFTYVVQPGDTSSDLEYLSSGALVLGGASITDIAGNAAVLTLPTPGGADSLSANKNIVIDTEAPTNEDSVFSADITKKGGKAVAIASSGDSTNRSWFAASGTTTFVSSATSTRSASGTSLTLNAPATEGQYKLFVIDAAGNVSDESTATLTVDNTAPTLTAVHIESSNTNTHFAKALDTVYVTFTTNEPILSASSTVNGHVATVVPLGGNEYEASAQLLAGDTEGPVSYAINLEDLYGNVATGLTTLPTDGSSVVFDKTKASSSVTINGSALTYYTNHTPVTVDYTASDSGAGVYATALYSSYNSGAFNLFNTLYTNLVGSFTYDFSQGEGVYTFFSRAVDNAGNQENSSLGEVTAVYDTTAPVISLHSPVTEEATSALGAIVSYTAPSVTDNLDPGVVASCAPTAGASFVLGDTVVTCNATDAAGNSATPVTFTVHVVDTTKPIIAPHGDESAEATSSFGASVTYSAPATSDAVDGAGTASCVPASGSLFALGTTPVTCSAIDTHGNSADPTTFTVTVVDTTAPVIEAHADETVEAIDASGATVSYANPSATDAVDGTDTVTCSLSSGSLFPLGDTTVDCDAVDAHGNHATQTHFVVHVVDTTAPGITAPTDEQFEATGALTTPTLTPAVATDAVDSAVAVTYAPHDFPVGTTEVLWTATDDSGNHSSTTSHVTIVDTTAPDITPPADQTFEATGVLTTPTLTPATATDLVDLSVDVTYAPHDFSLGDTTVTWTATDDAGNHSSATSVVTITDHTPPTIASHDDVTAEATSGAGAIVTYTNPIATDLVDGTVVVTCTLPSGSTFVLGDTTVHCDASDAHSNAAVQTSFVVHVIDTTAPVVSIDPLTQTIEATGPSGAVATFNATATDSVDGSLTPFCDIPSGSTFILGNTLVSCGATDTNNNSATTTAHVIVEDTTPPVIGGTPLPDVTQDANGVLSTVVLTPPSVTDVVDVAPTVTNDAPASYPVGTTVVTWTAHDASGNTSTATQNVIVVPAPIAKVTVSPAPASITVPGPVVLTVNGRDAFNHITTNQSGSVVIVSADNGGALDDTLVTLVNGAASTNLTKSSAGVVHVTVSSGVLTPNSKSVTFIQADTTDPTVSSFSPALNATGIAVSAPIFVNFSEPLKFSTVNSTNIQLWVATTTPTQLPATISLVDGGTRANITPSSPLDFSTSYYILVTTGVEDEAGNALTTPLDGTTTGFTTVADTADHTPPTVVSTNPVDSGTGVLLSATPSVTWSKALNPATVTTSSLVLKDASDTIIPASVALVDGGTRAILTPTSALSYSTTYHVVASGDITDLVGNAYLGGGVTLTTFTTVSAPVEPPVTLAVTQVDAIKTFATADDTFPNGWKWVFHITVPTLESVLKMKFADLVSGANVIPAANNIRFYSAQSSDHADAGSALLIEAANTYKGDLHLTGDTDSSTPGRQVDVTVEVKVPLATPGGSYSTSYGVSSNTP